MTYLMKSTKERECTDCGKTIEIGEIYYNDRRKDINRTYCKPCKDKPEHCRRTFDHEEIVLDLLKKPLFKHEFHQKYDQKGSGNGNNLMRRLMMKYYTVRIFRWNRRSRTISRISKKEEYKLCFQPNDFIIYYIEGTEHLVVKRMLDAFDYEDVAWKPILRSLYGIPVPSEIFNEKSLVTWANQNVFKYMANSSNSIQEGSGKYE